MLLRDDGRARVQGDLVASSKASAVASFLESEASILRVLAANPEIQQAIQAAAAALPADESERANIIRARDAQWRLSSVDSEVFRSALENPAASVLDIYTEHGSRDVQILVLDAFGLLVATTASPKQYDFSSETWWQASRTADDQVHLVAPYSLAEVGSTLVLNLALTSEQGQLLGSVHQFVPLKNHPGTDRTPLL